MSDAKLQLTWENRSKYAKEVVRPVVLRPIKSKSVRPDEQTGNMVIEGNNLDVMAALLTGGFALRGQVDLCLWDPPYNTGKNDFRYNDNYYLNQKEVKALKAKAPIKEDWDVVSPTDPSRHTKWLTFMEVRLRKAQELLKPGGVMAVCIGFQELFRLGCLMDELFGEGNRLGVINWQTTYSAKNDSSHLSTATEYVLVYANYKDRASTALLDRTEAMDARYKNPDKDPKAVWKSGDASAPGAETHPGMIYAIQSPFTGKLYYPPQGRCWGFEKKLIRQWLEEWGCKYHEVDIHDGKRKALLLAGSSFNEEKIHLPSGVQKKARTAALNRLREGNWPRLYFGLKGETGPQTKRYLEDVKKGRVPLTYWADEEYETPFTLDSQSWPYTESGHSQSASNLLNDIIGGDQHFDTVKPIKLFEKIIQLWCPPGGFVLDAFGGSGTTGHAVLSLNNKVAESKRRFIIMESGNGPDRFCNALTAERVRRVISGKWAKGKQPALHGGFTYYESGGRITRKVIMEAAHMQLADIILQSAADVGDRVDCRIDNPSGYIIGRTRKGNAIALVWRNTQVLTNKIYMEILAEAKKLKMRTPVFIYARANDAIHDDDYLFCIIPDKILAALGLVDDGSENGE